MDEEFYRAREKERWTTRVIGPILSAIYEQQKKDEIRIQELENQQHEMQQENGEADDIER